MQLIESFRLLFLTLYFHPIALVYQVWLHNCMKNIIFFMWALFSYWPVHICHKLYWSSFVWILIIFLALNRTPEHAAHMNNASAFLHIIVYNCNKNLNKRHFIIFALNWQNYTINGKRKMQNTTSKHRNANEYLVIPWQFAMIEV